MNFSFVSQGRMAVIACYSLLAGLALFWNGVSALGAGIEPDNLQAVDIANPSYAGGTTHHNGVVEITAAGRGIGLKSDQFHFAAAPASGDFDVRVRVAVLKNTDLWAKAGLMLRSDLDAKARFAGVFTTPSGAGALFQSREVVGGDALNQGTFPANQPFAWLRLRREGALINGYASYDGRRWKVLGTKTSISEQRLYWVWP